MFSFSSHWGGVQSSGRAVGIMKNTVFAWILGYQARVPRVHVHILVLYFIFVLGFKIGWNYTGGSTVILENTPYNTDCRQAVAPELRNPRKEILPFSQEREYPRAGNVSLVWYWGTNWVWAICSFVPNSNFSQFPSWDKYWEVCAVSNCGDSKDIDAVFNFSILQTSLYPSGLEPGMSQQNYLIGYNAPFIDLVSLADRRLVVLVRGTF